MGNNKMGPGQARRIFGVIVVFCLGLAWGIGDERLSAQDDSPQAFMARAFSAESGQANLSWPEPFLMAQAVGAGVKKGDKGEEKKSEVEAKEPEAPHIVEKPLSARSTAHLYELISREPPLIKQEVQTYEQHLEDILALDSDPAIMAKILETTGWSQERLTYVVTKMGVGLSNILYPENPRLINAPDFINPTPEERELIVDHLKSLVKGYQKLSKPKQEPKAKKARG